MFSLYIYKRFILNLGILCILSNREEKSITPSEDNLLFLLIILQLLKMFIYTKIHSTSFSLII